MYFLGQAGNYRAKDILRHTFAFGTKQDFRLLKAHLAHRYGTKESAVTLLNNGRSALALALKATLPKNSQVIITSFTCYAVYQAVVAAGCTPIFADIDKKTLHFGEKELKATLKAHPKASAIIIQNNLGIPVDIAKIEKIAKKHQLKIIEDLAHCAGVSYKDGREVGTVGVATALSFGKGKSIDTITGGALVLRTGNPAPPANKKPKVGGRLRARFYPLLGASIRGFYHLKLGKLWTSLLLKLHFIEKSADAPLDTKARLTFWQAKLALKQLQTLPKNRPPLREFYLVKNREHCLKVLEDHGFVMNDLWYECPVSPERYFKRIHLDPKTCPTAFRITQEIINLPTHYPKEALAPARAIINKERKS